MHYITLDKYCYTSSDPVLALAAVCEYLYVYVCVYVFFLFQCMYVCMYVCVCMYICMYVCMYDVIGHIMPE